VALPERCSTQRPGLTPNTDWDRDKRFDMGFSLNPRMMFIIADDDHSDIRANTVRHDTRRWE